MDALTDEVASPCTGICHLDPAGHCAGCRRTLDEIARWSMMTTSERRAVVTALPERPAAAAIA